jgi:hypothetical protein
MSAERDPSVSRPERTLLGRLAAVGHTGAVVALVALERSHHLPAATSLLVASTALLLVVSIVGA